MVWGTVMNKTVPFSMRLDPALKATLQARADADRRSLTNFVEKILRDYVEQDGNAAPQPRRAR